MKGLMMDTPLTLQYILERARRMYPKQEIATKFGTEMHRYTYADFYERVGCLANALAQLGIQPGDRVATLAWNTYRHLELYFAVPCMGAVLHTLNLRLPAGSTDLHHQPRRRPRDLHRPDPAAHPREDRAASRDGQVLRRHGRPGPAMRNCSTTLPPSRTMKQLLAAEVAGVRLARNGRERRRRHVLHLGHHRQPQGRALFAPGDLSAQHGRVHGRHASGSTPGRHR